MAYLYVLALMVIFSATSINIFAEDSWGYKGPLGAITYCDSTISTYVSNATPNPVKVVSVDGGKEFIATKNKLNTLGTKKTYTGIIDAQEARSKPTRMKVLEISSTCINQPKNDSKMVDFNIHILLPGIGEVILSEKFMYEDGQAKLKAISITAGQNNTADKHINVQWTGSYYESRAQFTKGIDEYTIGFFVHHGLFGAGRQVGPHFFIEYKKLWSDS